MLLLLDRTPPPSYLRSQMDAEGFVDVALLMNFPRVKKVRNIPSKQGNEGGGSWGAAGGVCGNNGLSVGVALFLTVRAF